MKNPAAERRVHAAWELLALKNEGLTRRAAYCVLRPTAPDPFPFAGSSGRVRKPVS